MKIWFTKTSLYDNIYSFRNSILNFIFSDLFEKSNLNLLNQNFKTQISFSRFFKYIRYYYIKSDFYKLNWKNPMIKF